MDSRIKVIHKENGGVSSARNYGLREATGEYLVWIDADDSIHPEMIRILLDTINDSLADLVLCGHNACNEDGTLMASSPAYSTPHLTKEEYLHEIICQSRITIFTLWAKISKRSLFDGIIFPEGIDFEDAYVLCDLIDRCSHIVTINDHLYNYTIRSGSITNSQKTLASAKVLEAHLRQFDYSVSVGKLSWAKDLLQHTCLNTRYFYCAIQDNRRELKTYLHSVKKRIYDRYPRVKKQMSPTEKIRFFIFRYFFAISCAVLAAKIFIKDRLFSRS